MKISGRTLNPLFLTVHVTKIGKKVILETKVKKGSNKNKNKISKISFFFKGEFTEIPKIVKKGG